MNIRQVFLFSLLFLVFSGYLLSAQPPDWTNPETRQSRYPDHLYRTGFFAESKVQETEKTFIRLKELAKSQLIESIQVSIKSVSSLTVEESKGNSQDLFTFQSLSLSESDIIDLTVETYYDKKQKKGYAFAYVKTEKLVAYYTARIANALKNIEQNLENIPALTTSGNFVDVLNNIFEVKNDIKKINGAQSILMALGVSNKNTLQIEATNKHANTASEHLFTVLNDNRLTAAHLTHYFVLVFNQDFTRKNNTVALGAFTYEDYSLTSELSTILNKSFQAECGSLSNITIGTAGTDFLIKGSFREQNDQVIIEARLMDGKETKIINSAEGKVSQQVFRNEKIAYLPLEVQKLNTVRKISLSSSLTTLSAKVNEPVNSVYKVVAKVKGPADRLTPVDELPIGFYVNTKNNVTQLITNEQGETDYVIGTIKSPVKTQFIYAEVNLPAYLKMDSTLADFKRLTKNLAIPKIKVRVNVYGNILRIVSQESNLDQPIAVPYLQAGIVDALTKVGFQFTKNEKEADYNLLVKANTKRGSSFESLYFSYLDATISMIDTKHQKEVFSTQYQNIKAGGSNFESAGTKAYSIALKKIQEELIRYFNN